MAGSQALNRCRTGPRGHVRPFPEKEKAMELWEIDERIKKMRAMKSTDDNAEFDDSGFPLRSEADAKKINPNVMDETETGTHDQRALFNSGDSKPVRKTTWAADVISVNALADRAADICNEDPATWKGAILKRGHSWALGLAAALSAYERDVMGTRRDSEIKNRGKYIRGMVKKHDKS